MQLQGGLVNIHFVDNVVVVIEGIQTEMLLGFVVYKYSSAWFVKDHEEMSKKILLFSNYSLLFCCS